MGDSLSNARLSAAGRAYNRPVLTPSGLAIALILIGLACPAFAQTEPTDRDAEAHALFEAGRMAFTEGHYEDAYERYAEAYRLSQRPELLYNMGSAADRLRRDELALEHYRAFLIAVPDTPQRLDVEHRIAILERAAPDDRAPAVPPVVVVAPAAAPPEQQRDPEIWEQWWLWTILGVVVVGAGVGIGVGVATASPSMEAPIPGDVGPGGVVLTLTF